MSEGSMAADGNTAKKSQGVGSRTANTEEMSQGVGSRTADTAEKSQAAENRTANMAKKSQSAGSRTAKRQEAGERMGEHTAWDWQADFIRLKHFTETCGDIRVTGQSLSVPGGRKAEFYRLTEQARKALGMQVLGEYGRMGKQLVRKFSGMRQQMLAGTNLKEFCLADAVENLLEDPEAAMAKQAFGIVLDGLQQGLSPKDMEESARRQVVPYCKDLLRNLYEAWLYYGIVAAMKPVRFYGVCSPDTVSMEAVDTDRIAAGFQTASPERRMPEAVFVTEDGRVFAMKSEAAEELDCYGERPGRCRDLSAGGNTVDQIAHRVLLLYRIDSAEHVPLLANREKLHILPSDLMCEFLLPEEMERPLSAAGFEKRIRTVRSRRPVQVLTWDENGAFPDGFLKDSPGVPPVFVERRIVGTDEGKLMEIAGILREG